MTKWATINILCGAAWAAIAIDRIFFHVDQPLGRFTLIVAGGYLLGGTMNLYRANGSEPPNEAGRSRPSCGCSPYGFDFQPSFFAIAS